MYTIVYRRANTNAGNGNLQIKAGLTGSSSACSWCPGRAPARSSARASGRPARAPRSPPCPPARFPTPRTWAADFGHSRHHVFSNAIYHLFFPSNLFLKVIFGPFGFPFQPVAQKKKRNKDIRFSNLKPANYTNLWKISGISSNSGKFA